MDINKIWLDIREVSANVLDINEPSKYELLVLIGGISV